MPYYSVLKSILNSGTNRVILLLCFLLIQNAKSSKRRVQIQITHESKPDLAVDFIEYVLTHPVNRGCLLSLPKKKLKKLLKILGAAKVVFSLS